MQRSVKEFAETDPAGHLWLPAARHRKAALPRRRRQRHAQPAGLGVSPVAVAGGERNSPLRAAAPRRRAARRGAGGGRSILDRVRCRPISPPRRTGGSRGGRGRNVPGGICRSQAFSRISTESTRIIPSRRIRRTARSGMPERHAAALSAEPVSGRPRKLCAGGWLSCRAKMRGSIRCSACWRAIRACFPQAPAPEKARIYRFTTI